MRSIQSSKNAVAGLISQIVVLIIGFATKTVFIHTLSATYLGVNGLFQSILTILNVSELGIGTSIIYALYKPISENDSEKIKSLMRFYKRAYVIIGTIVFTLGIVFLPFINYFIKEEIEQINLKIVFALYIIESVSSYWIFGYKRAILQANQQEYIITKYNSIIRVIFELIRIAVLFFLTQQPSLSFYIYLSLGIIYQVIVNCLLSIKVNKIFPFLKDKDISKLQKEDSKAIMKNVAGASISKISGVMINSIDNILLSTYVGIVVVGVYSNYVALKSYLIIPLSIIFGSMSASIGDFCAREGTENKKELFNTLQFAYFWFYGFASIGFFIMCNPFIETIWIKKEEYLLGDDTVLIISLILLLDGLSGAVISFRDSHGLYWKTKYRYLFSAVFNFVVSLLLVKSMGINGVLLGTLLSVLLIVLFDPVIVFKNVFFEKPLKYYLTYCFLMLIVIATGAFVWWLSLFFKEAIIINFIIKLLICIVVPNLIWFLIFRKDQRFINIKSKLVSVIKYIEKRG